MPKKKKGKEELKEIAPGILKKNEKTYYIVCKVSGKHCYCNAERLETLSKKYGGVDKIQDNYVSRDAKRLLKTGTKEKKIKELGADNVVEESRLIHKEKKERRARRKKKREEKAELYRKIPMDEKGPALTKDEIISKTSASALQEKNGIFGGMCLRPKYFNDHHNCGLCNYVEHCKADCKVVVYRAGKKLQKKVAVKTK